MKTLKLINPLILGKINTEYNGKNIEDVADKAWNSLSEHIAGSVPRFNFTLKDVNSDELYHFTVVEKVSNGKDIDYVIKKIDTDITKDQENKLIKHIDNLENKIANQVGGKRKRRYKDDDDDLDDFDCDDDDLYTKLSFYKHKRQPFYYWWYNPMIYTVYGAPIYTSIYLPTFAVPYHPYIEIETSSAFFA